MRESAVGLVRQTCCVATCGRVAKALAACAPLARVAASITVASFVVAVNRWISSAFSVNAWLIDACLDWARKGSAVPNCLPSLAMSPLASHWVGITED